MKGFYLKAADVEMQVAELRLLGMPKSVTKTSTAYSRMDMRPGKQSRPIVMESAKMKFWSRDYLPFAVQAMVGDWEHLVDIHIDLSWTSHSTQEFFDEDEDGLHSSPQGKVGIVSDGDVLLAGVKVSSGERGRIISDRNIKILALEKSEKRSASVIRIGADMSMGLPVNEPGLESNTNVKAEAEGLIYTYMGARSAVGRQAKVEDVDIGAGRSINILGSTVRGALHSDTGKYKVLAFEERESSLSAYLALGSDAASASAGVFSAPGTGAWEAGNWSEEVKTGMDEGYKALGNRILVLEGAYDRTVIEDGIDADKDGRDSDEGDTLKAILTGLL